RDRMTPARAAQRARRQRANADDADSLLLGAQEQAFEVDREPPLDLAAGRRIEQVVEDLCRINRAGVDHTMQRVRVAERGDPEKLELALLLQSLEGGDRLVEHLARADGAAGRRLRDRI